MPLTDTAVRAAKPQPRTRKLFDGGGLYLEVSPAGGKSDPRMAPPVGWESWLIMPPAGPISASNGRAVCNERTGGTRKPLG